VEPIRALANIPEQVGSNKNCKIKVKISFVCNETKIENQSKKMKHWM
jgi:hypothetical protein